MKQIKYIACMEDENKKIKDILRQKFAISAAVLTELKKSSEGILCNGKSVFATHRVLCGDEVVITLTDKASTNIEPIKIPLDIIYEDEDILVVNKPRSMPTHPSQNHHSDSLANAVMGYYMDSPITFRVITRLDKDTSGVVVIAKNKISAGILTEQMVNKSIDKEYVALCCGLFDYTKGAIEEPIARKEGSAILREVNPNGKYALSGYEVISSKDDMTLVRLFPKTGRTHQLRVHMAHIGHPIYGDYLYGNSEGDAMTRLHCAQITLTQPLTKEQLIFKAPIPDDMYI